MSTRSKYYRVKPQEQKGQDKPTTDVIMKFSPTYGRYVGRCLTLLFGEDQPSVSIKAAQRLSEKAVWVAEVVRRKVAGLHQIINITQKKIVDVYMPREQGLVKVEQERFLTVIEVVLTRKPTEEQKKAPGYQAPLTNVQGEFLTKQSWQNGQKQRAERREQRQSRPRGERNERNDRGDRNERQERTDTRGGQRGGQRRRGGRRD